MPLMKNNFKDLLGNNAKLEEDESDDETITTTTTATDGTCGKSCITKF